MSQLERGGVHVRFIARSGFWRVYRARQVRRPLMRALLASTLIAGAALCLAPAVFADSTSSTSGGGANVSIVTGDNGGTTIVIDSSKPCRIAQGDAAKGKSSSSSSRSSSSSSNSTTINTGPGGLSGSTTIGPNGPSVSMQSGASGATASSSANAAKPGECVVILH